MTHGHMTHACANVRNPKTPNPNPETLFVHAAVVMKVPKPKEGQEPRKMWIPPERLWFDKNQRIQVCVLMQGLQ
jgi:hypothetical protein